MSDTASTPPAAVAGADPPVRISRQEEKQRLKEERRGNRTKAFGRRLRSGRDWAKKNAAELIVLAVLVIGISTVAWAVSNANNQKQAKTLEETLPLTASFEEAPGPEGPVPALADGIQSWTEYNTAADALDKDNIEGNIMYDSLHELHPERSNIRKAVDEMVTLEEEGNSYLWTASIGVKFINTDYCITENSQKVGYKFFDDKTKDDVTMFLTWADNVPAVKAGCANSVRFYKQQLVAKKVAQAKKSTSKPGKPECPPSGEKEGCQQPDKTNGAAKQPLQDSNAVTTPTPGYTGGGSGSSGTAETIVKEQQATSGSMANNGQVGHAGSGAAADNGGTGGSTTPPSGNSSGESNSGGGDADTPLPGGIETPLSGVPPVPN